MGPNEINDKGYNQTQLKIANYKGDNNNQLANRKIFHIGDKLR
jgi:hypothetical protein